MWRCRSWRWRFVKVSVILSLTHATNNTSEPENHTTLYAHASLHPHAFTHKQTLNLNKRGHICTNECPSIRVDVALIVNQNLHRGQMVLQLLCVSRVIDWLCALAMEGRNNIASNEPQHYHKPVVQLKTSWNNHLPWWRPWVVVACAVATAEVIVPPECEVNISYRLWDMDAR